MRRNDSDRIREAELAGRAQRLRDLALTEPARWEALRVEWPELVERVEAAAALVDWDRAMDDEN